MNPGKNIGWYAILHCNLPCRNTTARSQRLVISRIKCSTTITATPPAHTTLGQLDYGIDFGRGQPGHYFVERQDGRLHHQRSRQLQPLAVHNIEGEGRARGLVCKAQPGQHLVSPQAGARDAPPGPLAPQQRPHHDDFARAPV
jgi:hypothetical protein